MRPDTAGAVAIDVALTRFTLRVRVKGVKVLKARIWIAAALIRVAAAVLGAGKLDLELRR